jgi:hypothetical protein
MKMGAGYEKSMPFLCILSRENWTMMLTERNKLWMLKIPFEQSHL